MNVRRSSVGCTRWMRPRSRRNSPQVLVIKNGQCVFDESHLGISMHDILEQAHAA